MNSITTGKNVYIECKGMWLRVKITDVRFVYGRTEYLVEPVHGKGHAWVKEVIDTTTSYNPF